MNPDATPRLTLPYILANQAQKHVTLNEALARLDAVVHASAQSLTATEPPEDPSPGQGWILPAGAGGAWAPFEPNDLVVWDGDEWFTSSVPEGGLVHLADLQALLVRTSDGWSPVSAHLGSLDNLGPVGIGAGADDETPLLVRGPGALIDARSTGEGGTGNVRLRLNREAVSNTASLIFQTADSGRAEVGLTGSEAVCLRLSADGAIWKDAVCISPTGRFGVNQPTPSAMIDAVVEDDTTSLFSGTVYSAGSSGFNLTGIKNRGDRTSPAGVLAGDRMMGFYGRARRSDGALSGNAVCFQMVAEEAFSASGQGTAVSFETTPVGGLSRRPIVRFQANGALRLMPMSAAPASPAAGEIYFDSTMARFRGYDGSTWVDLG